MHSDACPWGKPSISWLQVRCSTDSAFMPIKMLWKVKHQHTFEGATSAAVFVIAVDTSLRRSARGDDSSLDVARRLEPAKTQLSIACVWMSYNWL